MVYAAVGIPLMLVVMNDIGGLLHVFFSSIYVRIVINIRYVLRYNYPSMFFPHIGFATESIIMRHYTSLGLAHKHVHFSLFYEKSA